MAGSIPFLWNPTKCLEQKSFTNASQAGMWACAEMWASAGAELDLSLERLIHSVKARKLEGMVAKRYASGRAGG